MAGENGKYYIGLTDSNVRSADGKLVDIMDAIVSEKPPKVSYNGCDMGYTALFPDCERVDVASELNIEFTRFYSSFNVYLPEMSGNTTPHIQQNGVYEVDSAQMERIRAIHAETMDAIGKLERDMEALARKHDKLVQLGCNSIKGIILSKGRKLGTAELAELVDEDDWE